MVITNTMLSYLQAKNQLLSDTHECHSYHRGEDEKACVDVDWHERSSPGHWCKWHQVQRDSEKNLLSKGEEANLSSLFLCIKKTYNNEKEAHSPAACRK